MPYAPLVKPEAGSLPPKCASYIQVRVESIAIFLEGLHESVSLHAFVVLSGLSFTSKRYLH